ncbi:MAG TPA: UDP-N-acetylmuramate dehydrogenase [Polyangia bacterium]|nr:UDP-N-acetylmuramate dehydrogenase [Polyangia bacterium]
MIVARDVPLAPLTTLELGGPARFLVEAFDTDAVIAGLRWAAARGVPAFVLGGGSNLVVADAGFEGLVIRMRTRGVTFAPATGGEVLVEAQAGEPWDGLVAETVARDLAGLECLSGIPGLAGATPIQNVGAYGQEVADAIRSVRVIDRATLAIADLPPPACGFGYRDSLFRRQADRYVVASVTFALRPGGAPCIRYPELASVLAQLPSPSLADVRAAVLRLRRAKSMVIDAADPNRRSVGSFFTNPIVTSAQASALAERLLRDGTIAHAGELPRFPAGGDGVKLSAGWLIEHAGIARGLRDGAVGVSTKHALALVHHGGGTTAALLALAARVRRAVADRFAVTLVPEPILLGSLGAISIDAAT